MKMWMVKRRYSLKQLIVLEIFVSMTGLGYGGDNQSYGVDCSFPIHKFELDRCPTLLFADYRHDVYEKFMKGCQSKYGFDSCDQYERNRLSINSMQPAYSMVSSSSCSPSRTYTVVNSFVCVYC